MNAPTTCWYWLTSVLALSSSEAQGTFQNLNFESAAVVASPVVEYPNFVPISTALPDWSAYLGTGQQTQVGYNGPANSTASITLIGPTLNSSDVSLYGGVGVIDGNYSLDLQTGANPNNEGTTENASIEQNGTVPSTANSLQFEAYETTPLSVSFNGSALVPVALASGVSPDGVPYTLYGATISAWAGQTGELEFTADFNGSGNFVVLDDISFSTQSVPEPSPLALTGLGALVFALYRRFVTKCSETPN
jgi:hypothetical protein